MGNFEPSQPEKKMSAGKLSVQTDLGWEGSKPTGCVSWELKGDVGW